MTSVLKYLFLWVIYFPPMITWEKFKGPDEICSIWNQTTLNSLENQLEEVTDQRIKNYYKNRIFGFKALMLIEDGKIYSKKSIRYKFLCTILPEFRNKEVYIIEANIIGSKNIIRNFLITRHHNNIFQVDLYLFTADELWKKKGTCSASDLEFQLPLKKNTVDYPTGFNHPDFIITHCKLDKPYKIDAEYFLSTTLSSENGMQKILSMYENDAFK